MESVSYIPTRMVGCLLMRKPHGPFRALAQNIWNRTHRLWSGEPRPARTLHSISSPLESYSARHQPFHTATWILKYSASKGDQARDGTPFLKRKRDAPIVSLVSFTVCSLLERSQVDSVLWGLGDINVSAFCNTKSLLAAS